MMAKSITTLELHYPLIQFLIILYPRSTGSIKGTKHSLIFLEDYVLKNKRDHSMANQFWITEPSGMVLKVNWNDSGPALRRSTHGIRFI